MNGISERNPIAIFGAGGVGIDLGVELIACKEKVVFLDDNIFVKDRVYEIGAMLVGGSEKLDDPKFLRRHDLMVAIGDNAKRREVMTRAAASGATLSTFIHPEASVGTRISMSDGILIMRGASVSNRVRIGRGVIINLNASVPHDVILGDYVNICDGVTLGACEIGENSFVGLGAVIKTGIRVGKNAFVGMGSVVVYDVPDGARVFGNPARLINERPQADGQRNPDSEAALPKTGGTTVIPIRSGS
jgi:sugar O-acyltransferase (sialic acid O-acetyltransferase NeuD family)